MFDQEINGARWGVSYLTTDSRLPELERFRILCEATGMYLSEEDERYVMSEHYEGRVYTKREYGMLGAFGGVKYYAELDTTYGKSRLSFLISERTGGRNAPSMN
ncbi:MAG: hypothetical protein HYT73_02885 [Candidatus Aenigmarchaeota archaeon]|nr:hypothetical protein [Candidatus Aenigmarchaeota archaeon]